MTLSLKPTHLKRYKDIAVLLIKYGRGDLAKRRDVETDLPPASPGAEPGASAASPNAVGTVGVPRRTSSSAMHGSSSWMSE